jgi:antitoxin component of MazEF toxin-antitoxin module
MIKRLQKYGNSHALVIDKALLEATGIGPDMDLSVSVQADTITISRANVGIGRERVDHIMDRVERDYGKALKRLAE